MNRDALYDLCNGFLSALVTAWPTTLATPLPARQYVHIGSDIPWDCEQVVVAPTEMFPDLGDAAQVQWATEQPLLGMRGVIVSVFIIRCTPDIDSEGQEIILPTATEMDDAAYIGLGDANQIISLLVEAQTQGQLASCNGLAFQSWTPIGPQGGFGGGIVQFRVQLLGTEAS